MKKEKKRVNSTEKTHLTSLQLIIHYQNTFHHTIHTGHSQSCCKPIGQGTDQIVDLGENPQLPSLFPKKQEQDCCRLHWSLDPEGSKHPDKT